jgi:hypothetical protein
MSLTYDQHVASFPSLPAGQAGEIGDVAMISNEQFAEYGLAQCCACRRIRVQRHLGPPGPEGNRRCANWSDCREARAMAEMYGPQQDGARARESVGLDGRQTEADLLLAR